MTDDTAAEPTGSAAAVVVGKISRHPTVTKLPS